MPEAERGPDGPGALGVAAAPAPRVRARGRPHVPPAPPQSRPGAAGGGSADRPSMEGTRRALLRLAAACCLLCALPGTAMSREGWGNPAAFAAPELEQLFNRRWEPRAPKVGQSTARCGDAAGQSGGTKRQPRVPAAAPGPELRGSTWARAGGHAVGARPELGVGGTAGGPGKRGSDKAWGSAGSGRAPLLGCRENKKQNKAKSSQPAPLGNGGEGVTARRGQRWGRRREPNFVSGNHPWGCGSNPSVLPAGLWL